MRKILFCFVLFLSGCADPVLHGIGVYEGAYPQNGGHSFGVHPDGRVQVDIFSAQQPIIIVLSSYEPVVWTLKPSQDVVIKEVILSGYYPSKVVGLDAKVKITRKPFGYLYKSAGTDPAFMTKVFEYTGIKEFESYQGVYKGEVFSIH